MLTTAEPKDFLYHQRPSDLDGNGYISRQKGIGEPKEEKIDCINYYINYISGFWYIQLLAQVLIWTLWRLYSTPVSTLWHSFSAPLEDFLLEGNFPNSNLSLYKRGFRLFAPLEASENQRFSVFRGYRKRPKARNR